MTYRWEPTTPLDRILETGFKRIDEAVEGVIDRLAPTVLIDWRQLQREENYRLSKIVEEMALAAPTIWPTERGKADIQEQMLNRMGQNTSGGLLGDPNHCHAGMAAQQGAVYTGITPYTGIRNLFL